MGNEFECDRCGQCCEVLGNIMKAQCPSYDTQTKLCKDYENRPDFCRVELSPISIEETARICSILKGGE